MQDLDARLFELRGVLALTGERMAVKGMPAGKFGACPCADRLAHSQGARMDEQNNEDEVLSEGWARWSEGTSTHQW